MYRSPIIKQYRRYRRAGMELHHKIINRYLTDKVISEAARALELGENHELNLDTEEDLSVLMEYAIYEIKEDGINYVERYQKEVGGNNRVERDLLSAKITAQAELFVVRSFSPGKYTVEIFDLHDESRVLTLTDINFSQSTLKDVIIFLRPIELPDFTTTSGVTFVFPSEMQAELREKWKEWGILGRAERYAKIFQLYKSEGFPTFYE